MGGLQAPRERNLQPSGLSKVLHCKALQHAIRDVVPLQKSIGSVSRSKRKLLPRRPRGWPRADAKVSAADAQDDGVQLGARGRGWLRRELCGRLLC